jgi:hypothetical protein
MLAKRPASGWRETGGGFGAAAQGDQSGDAHAPGLAGGAVAPGIASGRRWPTSAPLPAPSQQHQARRPRRRRRRRSHDRRAPRRSPVRAGDVRPRRRRDGRRDAERATPAGPGLGEQGRAIVGMQIAGDELRLDIQIGQHPPKRSPRRSGPSAVLRSPRCCETKASRPRVTQTVAFRCAPTASTAGPSSPRSMGSGTNPRDRRMKAGAPSMTAMTESSAR